MAEGLLRAKGGTRYQVFSAGTHPRTVHPLAIKAMAELGIDISEQAGHRAKGIEEFESEEPMDLVVTVCDAARQACPVFPAARTVAHWDLPDPMDALGTEDEVLAVFRRSRDTIAGLVERLMALPVEALPPRHLARQVSAFIPRLP